MANIANLTMDQGSTFTFNVILETLTDTPWNLTSWSARGHMRKAYSSESETASFTATHNNNGGKITCTLTSAQTATIAGGEYLYDVQIYDSADPPVVHRVVEGKIKVKPEVTK